MKEIIRKLEDDIGNSLAETKNTFAFLGDDVNKLIDRIKLNTEVLDFLLELQSHKDTEIALKAENLLESYYRGY